SCEGVVDVVDHILIICNEEISHSKSVCVNNTVVSHSCQFTPNEELGQLPGGIDWKDEFLQRQGFYDGPDQSSRHSLPWRRRSKGTGVVRPPGDPRIRGIHHHEPHLLGPAAPSKHQRQRVLPPCPGGRSVDRLLLPSGPPVGRGRSGP